jgi:hypothetical protein
MDATTRTILSLEASADRRHASIDGDAAFLQFLEAVAASPDPCSHFADNELAAMLLRRAASDLLADHHLRRAHLHIDIGL